MNVQPYRHSPFTTSLNRKETSQIKVEAGEPIVQATFFVVGTWNIVSRGSSAARSAWKDIKPAGL